MALGQIIFSNEARPCIFGGEVKGVFHGWFSVGQIVPGGIKQRILGLVEDEEGRMYHLEPEYIRFVDDKVKSIFKEGCYDENSNKEETKRDS